MSLITTEDQCTCPTPLKDNTSKSWTQRIKERFIKPSKLVVSSDSESKISEEEEQEEEEERGSESSGSSSGIGTISTRSKLLPDESEDDFLPAAIEAQSTRGSISKGNVWISKTNPGIFSKLKKSTADLYDKISIAENDDHDFENFPNNEDDVDEETMRVKDWHIDMKEGNEEAGTKHDNRVQVLRRVTHYPL